MLRSDYDTQVCSIARALEVVGERWTLLVLRDIFLGNRRFDAIQAHLGIARNVLQSRLERLLEHEVIEKVPYQDRPVRHEYRLTPKGIDLWPTIVSLLQWGDRHALAPAGPPVLLRHKGCGGEVDGHRQQARFRWEAGPPGSAPVAIGFDVMLLDGDRIRAVYGFLDNPPT